MQTESLFSDALMRLRQNRLAIISFYFLITMGLLVVFGPLLSPYDYYQQDLSLGISAPSWQHWFGTDILGRDLLTRVLYGGRISLLVGLVATAVAISIGIAWGMVAGYLGGWVDNFMMRIVDVLYALPFMIFIILLTVVFGHSLLLLFLAIGCVEWLTMARIVRAQVRIIRVQPYIEAAYALGVPSYSIMSKHIVPNILGSVMVYITLTIPNVMLLEAFLSFLGLGIQPPQSSWGVLLSHGAEHMEEYPWLLLFPGMALSLTLFALNYLGDGLRDALDPLAESAA